MQRALGRSNADPGELDSQIHTLRAKMLDLDEQLNGNRSKGEPGEKTRPTVQSRISAAYSGTSLSTYGPTEMHRMSYEIAEKEHQKICEGLAEIVNDEIPELIKKLEEAGAPAVEGTFRETMNDK
jgi:hypothetical protein